MTIDEFLEKLAKTNEEWEIKDRIFGSPGIRTKKEEDSISCFCPITAVCYDTKYLYYSIGDFLTAAKHLGLSPEDARDIAKAADGDYGPDDPLRQKLLVAVKLKK